MECRGADLSRPTTKPRQLKGTLFDRLYELMEFSNFSDMEYSEYMSQMIAKIDRRAQLAYARKEGFGEGEARGMEKLLSLWESGVPLAEAKRQLGLKA